MFKIYEPIVDAVISNFRPKPTKGSDSYNKTKNTKFALEAMKQLELTARLQVALMQDNKVNVHMGRFSNGVVEDGLFLSIKWITERKETKWS